MNSSPPRKVENMKYAYILIALVLTACAVPFIGELYTPTPEQTEQAFGFAATIATLFNPLVGAGITALGGGVVAYQKNKGQKKIVGAIDASLNSLSSHEEMVIKKALSENMDEDTKKLVRKIKNKL